MEGGTVFHFVTEGIEAALDQARAAAQGKDVRIGGGASTIRQYLQARVIDEMHLAISPILLGRGEPLFQGIDLPALGYRLRMSRQRRGQVGWRPSEIHRDFAFEVDAIDQPVASAVRRPRGG